MTITMEIPDSVLSRINRIASQQKVDAATVARDVIIERFGADMMPPALDEFDAVVAELDALPVPKQTLDWSRINTASCYEDAA